MKGFWGLIFVKMCKMFQIQWGIILVIGQLNAQILFFIVSLLYSSTCFRHYCAHHQEVEIILYGIWYRHSL